MLIDLLEDAARATPERDVVITQRGGLGYADAVDRAHAIARGLQARGITRFGCPVEDAGDVVLCLAAASLTGSEACVYPRDLDEAGWSTLAARFDHDVVVTDRPATLTHGEAVTLADLEAAEGPPATRGEASPVLILTTGTTGDQKGARHDWARLARGVRGAKDAPDARWLLAYNPNQFAGLQVLLYVLAGGTTAVVPASRQPDDVIAALRDHAVTHVSATPTFWRLLVGGLEARGTGDLALEQITLGGEASPGPLLARLRALFPSVRISHVYAGTEFGSAVSVRDGLPGLPLSVLERDDDSDVQLRIVDGELQMRSRVGMLGYHGGGDDDDEWRPTGDLVEVRDDRIHFVGRTSEIINVGGAKIHPLPIEEIVGAIPGVQLAAVYGRPSPVTGQIVALDVVAAPDTDTEALEETIRSACSVLPRAGQPRRIRFVDALQVKGNKLVRQETA